MTAPHHRFREARGRLGLTPEQFASRSGINSPSVWDIEEIAGELTSCYSPREVQRFCQILGIRPVELFAGSVGGSPISADELNRLIHAECRSRGITLHQFEDAVGWRFSACMEPPEHLFEDITVDGLQWLCRELRIDWRRVFLSL